MSVLVTFRDIELLVKDGSFYVENYGDRMALVVMLEMESIDVMSPSSELRSVRLYPGEEMPLGKATNGLWHCDVSYRSRHGEIPIMSGITDRGIREMMHLIRLIGPKEAIRTGAIYDYEVASEGATFKIG